MRTSVRLFIGVAAGALVAGAVAPAQAGTTWGSPQEVSSKLGRAISLSNDGTVAAWIRTNRMTGSGPVRTSYFKSAKKGWTSSAPIPGTAGVTALQVSSTARPHSSRRRVPACNCRSGLRETHGAQPRR